MRRRRHPLAEALCCGEERRGIVADGCEVYVLSAHVPEDELSSSSEAAADESWLPWGIGAWLFPFEALDMGARPKGGICTQCLLAVLRSRGEAQTEPERGRRWTVSCRELLGGMRSVAAAAGCPSALLTLRSSCPLPTAAARLLPSIGELRAPPRALLVGICYTGSADWKLQGAWNDISDLLGWLSTELQWPRRSIRVLSDRLRSASLQPTRANILRHLEEWLLMDERSDDDPGQSCRLLHFCGHGGTDELYPIDWETAGTISGADLAQRLASGLPSNTTFTCILDCCESSSLFDSLQYALQLPSSSPQTPSWWPS